jgi:hypothetical protein
MLSFAAAAAVSYSSKVILVFLLFIFGYWDKFLQIYFYKSSKTETETGRGVFFLLTKKHRRRRRRRRRRPQKPATTKKKYSAQKYISMIYLI